MTLEPHNPATSELTDSHLAEKVSAILQSLSKFIHGKKIYAKNNPTLEAFASEFRSGVESFFADQDELVLTIEQYAIKWFDTVVYENDKREGSLAFVLYKDGIGELTLQSTISNDELDRFVDIIKDEIHSFSSEEDVVTRLWKADFENISYRVLDEYLVGEFGERQPQRRRTNRRRSRRTTTRICRAWLTRAGYWCALTVTWSHSRTTCSSSPYTTRRMQATSSRVFRTSWSRSSLSAARSCASCRKRFCTKTSARN